MATARSGKTDQEMRGLLGCFLFGGDDVDKKIKILSGGEKARVALAKVISSKSNFLMLDEPTNHLDMVSVELLADALGKYQGTLISVSHDRFFISKVANKIWEIVDGEIKVFDGPYDEYVEWKERMAKRAKEENQSENKKTEAPKSAPIVEKKQVQLSREEQKESEKIRRRFAKVEENIAHLNTQKTQAEKEMALPDTYLQADKFASLENKHQSILMQIKEANKEYEELFEKVMALDN